MKFVRLEKIKYLLGLVIFSIVFSANISYIQASYSAGTLVSMTNGARAENGLGALSTNSALASAAYAKAQDILADDYFAHNAPDGKTPWDFINESGYSYAYAGENLGIGYTGASELFSAWMNSSTHRENILNPNYREIGIAVVSGEYEGVETIVVVSEFGATQEDLSSQVESSSATSQPATADSSPTNQTSVPAATNQDEVKTFEFVKDKSGFSPKSIFAGEEIELRVTISGNVKTLEAQILDQKINLLETGSVTGSDQEKTYTIKQKIENKGLSEVKIVGMDQAGNSNSLALGDLEVKETVISKGQNEDNIGLIGGFKESLKDNWLIYTLSVFLLVLSVAGYLVYRKTKFNDLLASWRF